MTVRITQTHGKGSSEKLNAMAVGIAFAIPTALRQAGNVSKAHLTVANAAMSGGDLRLSNAGNLGVRYDVKTSGKAGGSVTVKPVGGSVYIATNDTVPHLIGLGRGSKAKSAVSIGGKKFAKSKVGISLGGTAKNVKLLSINGNVVRAPVRHPGTSGKGGWQRTREVLMHVELPKVMRAIVTKAAFKPFKG